MKQASINEIYRELMLLIHPDMIGPNDLTETRELKEEWAKIANQARERGDLERIQDLLRNANKLNASSESIQRFHDLLKDFEYYVIDQFRANDARALNDALERFEQASWIFIQKMENNDTDSHEAAAQEHEGRKCTGTMLGEAIDVTDQVEYDTIDPNEGKINVRGLSAVLKQHHQHDYTLKVSGMLELDKDLILKKEPLLCIALIDSLDKICDARYITPQGWQQRQTRYFNCTLFSPSKPKQIKLQRGIFS
jgi:hypothetical protein